MIKFFRNIRKKLLAEGKTANYLKYAIGEIILVVIGILIALQINNWNENKKAKEKEVKLLIELKGDLLETKNDLLTDIEKTQHILSTTNMLYKAIIADQVFEKKPFKLSTSYILETASLFPKLSAYEAIQSEGITIISNDSLRKKVTDFYQLHLKRVAAAEEYLEDINNKVLKPYLNKFSKYGSKCKDCKDLYELYSSNQEARLNLYLISKVDDELVHMLKEKFNVFKTLNQRYLELSSLIDEIIISIDYETNPKL
ncbi:DUF6090 family protein [Yeosuana sp. MJ-SS3]|uniref:DUF6090 family protein n=1 Tax=Gilvirhabdus luticola TaxID=3079858 RepID=A0ABU3U9X9_9FLAO|nr:DUF6090 family protein [Yeosuana sp. MJ-SS3]MDU8887222.1 DUF6090 family protein [Yeosuana sp. MJ-SS3]